MSALVDKVIAAMQEKIEKHGLEVLQRYPNDLLVHDRATLEKFATQGARVAWMVGHSHTHLVPLGIHASENQNVTYMTNLASEDRFYQIRFGHGEHFTINETDRKGFADLCHTPVLYERSGNDHGFSLYRNKTLVGRVDISPSGNWQERRYIATIAPAEVASKLDLAALEMWSCKSTTRITGTLFTKIELVWTEPIRLNIAA